MKIIAGSARGRVLKSFTNKPELRPILARVKKSLFDILTPRIPQAKFLDLFSGTGSVGIEALSRGASLAVFVEQNKASTDLIRENLRMLGFEPQAKIFNMDVFQALPLLNELFNLIFIGAPYKDRDKKMLAMVTPTLIDIKKNQRLEKNGLIIAQHHKKEMISLPDQEWTISRVERYGDTMLSFIRWKT